MQAVWLENKVLGFREDVPVPEPHSGEALVRVRLAGICSTDLELVKGYYPFAGILGHEFVGEIAASPDRPERVGERVVGKSMWFADPAEPVSRGDPATVSGARCSAS